MDYMPEKTESYREGYHNGRTDARIGLQLRMALASTWGYYAQGYGDGQRDERNTQAGRS